MDCRFKFYSNLLNCSSFFPIRQVIDLQKRKTYREACLHPSLKVGLLKRIGLTVVSALRALIPLKDHPCGHVVHLYPSQALANFLKKNASFYLACYHRQSVQHHNVWYLEHFSNVKASTLDSNIA